MSFISSILRCKAHCSIIIKILDTWKYVIKYVYIFAIAMNCKLDVTTDVQANKWADKVREYFERDSVLTWHYNHVMSGGKWNHIMD